MTGISTGSIYDINNGRRCATPGMSRSEVVELIRGPAKPMLQPEGNNVTYQGWEYEKAAIRCEYLGM